MNDEDDFQPLRDSLLHHDAETLTDAIVDAFLTGVDAYDGARYERIRRIFVSRLFADVHPRPVRTVEKPWSFGRWIEAIRTSLGLSRHDIALAVGADAALIEKVEESQMPPWTLRLETVADLVCLFRLHIDAVEQLFLKSQAVWNGQRAVRAAARSSVRDGESRADSAKRALDLYLAASSAGRESSSLPSHAIHSLRLELEKRGALELLRASE